MKHLFWVYKENGKERGFMLLFPLMLFSLLSISSASALLYRAKHFEYALHRYEEYIEEKYSKISCENLGALYQSYDPYFLIHC